MDEKIQLKRLSNKFKKLPQDKSAAKIPTILPYGFFEATPYKTPKNKAMLQSGENINRKHTYLGNGILLRLEKKLGINLDFLRKAIFALSYYTPFKITIKQFPKTCDIVKKLENNELKNIFAVLSNNNQGKNIFNLPCFIDYRLHEAILSNKPPATKLPQKFCCMIISNSSAFERIRFTLALSKYKKVDIFGKTIHTNSNNSKLPKTHRRNPQFFQQYKFVICFENSFAEEYITEKLPLAMLGNTIPIYRGAPNVGDYLNTDAFINYEDYNSSYPKMIEKIIELDQDDKKYTQLLNQPFITKQNKATINAKVKQLDLFLERVMV